MESDEDFNPGHCSISSLSGIWYLVSGIYNLFGSGVSCLRIKRLRDLETEFLICEILSTLCE